MLVRRADAVLEVSTQRALNKRTTGTPSKTHDPERQTRERKDKEEKQGTWDWQSPSSLALLVYSQWCTTTIVPDHHTQ